MDFPPSEEEIEALLRECPRHLRHIVETALNTGMRKEELLSLKWDQVRGGLIHLRDDMTKSSRGPARSPLTTDWWRCYGD